MGIIILIVVIIVGLAGLLVQHYYSKEAPNVEEPKSDFDILTAAIDSGDVSACDQFNPIKQTLCRKTILGELGEDNPAKPPETEEIIAQAAALNDSSLCDSIISNIQRNRCLVESGAINDTQPEEYYIDPETNETQRTEYGVVEDITALATETGDSSLCDQISNPVKRQRCIAKSS